jgi:hypothetical protein
MGWIRLILLFLLIALGLSIILGNPVFLTMTVLGIQTPPMPLWVLLLGAIVLGVFTGTLLQRILDLKPLPSKTSVRRPLPKKKKPHRPQKTVNSKAQKKQNRRSTTASRRPIASGTDWDESRPQDWFDRPQKGSATEYVSRDSQDDYFERPTQRPSTPASDRVVDADYRVLTPPYHAPPPRPRRSDSEWDDEFFDDD